MRTNIHYGSYQTIPDSASEGLVFLKTFLPVFDSLDATPQIHAFVLDTAMFVTNRDPPVTLENLPEMFEIRSKMLQSFRHDVIKAWEIEGDSGITVIFEGESTTQFKGDKVQVKVAEMNVWELKRDNAGVLNLAGARCWMDVSAVQDRAKEFFGSK